MDFSNVINILFVLSIISSTAFTHKSSHHQAEDDLLQRLQDLERKQGLADRHVARLDNIIQNQANIIKEQKNSMNRLESFVRNEAARTAHVLRLSRENRHRTSLIIKVLQQNNVTDIRHVLGNQHGPKSSSVKRPHALQSVNNDRQHGKNNNERTHPKSNQPVTSHHNKHQQQTSGSHTSDHTHTKPESPSRHEHNTHPKSQNVMEEKKRKAQGFTKEDHNGDRSAT